MLPVVVFAYDFPHRKTNDFLFDMIASGRVNPVVVAAPRKQLGRTPSESPFRPMLKWPPPLNTKDICRHLGLRYYRIPHESAADIEIVKEENGIELAIIAGARIIPPESIEVFKRGIINFHPGSIPETSGLDSFFYMLKKRAKPKVTTHFIDHRVDAGRLIFEHDIELNLDTTPEILCENIYQTQRIALRAILSSIDSIASKPIDRPIKNIPMLEQEKSKLLDEFESWKRFVISCG
jgi:folate-dependent phosphoribosylglycinamide formyltransferase PurN